MITELPGKDLLELLPKMPEGVCACRHYHAPRWCVEFNWELYAFKDNSQAVKDAWISEAIAQIGIVETVSRLRMFCHVCRTVQK